MGEVVESDRKWEIFNLGKRNEILRVDCTATPNRKLSSKKKKKKKSYLVTLFPTVLILLWLSLLYLINNTKFPRLNVYIRILCSFIKQLPAHKLLLGFPF